MSQRSIEPLVIKIKQPGPDASRNGLHACPECGAGRLQLAHRVSCRCSACVAGNPPKEMPGFNKIKSAPAVRRCICLMCDHTWTEALVWGSWIEDDTPFPDTPTGQYPDDGQPFAMVNPGAVERVWIEHKSDCPVCGAKNALDVKWHSRGYFTRGKCSACGAKAIARSVSAYDQEEPNGSDDDKE